MAKKNKQFKRKFIFLLCAASVAILGILVGLRYSESSALMLQGDRLLRQGKAQEAVFMYLKAYDLFRKSYELYNMCWALNLGIMDGKDLKNIDIPEKEKPILKEEKTVFAKMGSMVGKMLDCCRE